jgi:Putative prokaryotic signal transducing protein
MTLVGIDRPPCVPSAEQGSGGGSGWVELTRAKDDIDAHLLVGRLHGAGIETRSVKDRRAPGAWAYGGSNPWAPVTVMVRKLELDDARLVLAEIAFGAPDAPSPHHVAFDARMAVTWWVVAIALGVVLTLISLLQTASLASSCSPQGRCQRPYGAPARA